VLAHSCKEDATPTESSGGADRGNGTGSKHRPVIVAIGASAGGVQALQNFFGEISPNTGAAFIVVVHLDPQHRSELSSIMAARTKMPVIQIETTACHPS
jgi:chemotaxis response regulator CheB